ncbi:hypothetical protein ACFL6H_05740 [Candidatus Latescibacterota bacterium]
MKWFLVVITVAALLVNPAPVHAIFGIGVHGGIDNYTIDGFDKSFSLDDGTSVSLTREEISSPIMFGANFLVDVIPIIDLELSADVAMQDYKVTYGPSNDLKEYDATFGRVGVYATVRKNIISFPPVISTFSLYGGAGVGLHLISPVIGKNLIQDELKSVGEKLDTDELTKNLTNIGGHVLIGAQFKPPVIPFMISANAKYTLVGAGDYEEPGNFVSLYLTLGMKF